MNQTVLHDTDTPEKYMRRMWHETRMKQIREMTVAEMIDGKGL